MKKVLLLMSLFCFLSFVNGQGKRVVLAEEFTNTGCGPCAILNPHLDSLLNVMLGDVVSIKYHGWWPDSKDPMYLQAKAENDVRFGYYEVTGVPDVVVDGVSLSNSFTTINNYLKAKVKETSPFDFKLNYTVNDGVVTVNGDIKALESVAGTNMRLFFVVIEEDIIFEKPTSNGEKEFYNVMRKMLPDQNGFALPNQMAKDWQLQHSEQWTIGEDSFYDRNELAVVGFIQDIDTKEVFQAVYVPKINNKVDMAELVTVDEMPTRICIPNFSAKAMIRNKGNNALTSCKINFSVNDSKGSVNWTGNLAFLQNALVDVVDFNDFALVDGGLNNVKFWITDINGTSNISETYSNGFYSSLTAERQMELVLFTDKKPEEISWKVFNSVGDVVDENSGYNEQNRTYKQKINFKKDDCYSVVFYDAGGDGICCDNGKGYIRLVQLNDDGTSKDMFKGYYSGSEFRLDFSMKNVVPLGVDESSENVVLRVYPNPVRDFVSINAEGMSIEKAIIYDMSGREVKSINDGFGKIDVRELRSGMYLLSVVTGSGDVLMSKIVIE